MIIALAIAIGPGYQYLFSRHTETITVADVEFVSSGSAAPLALVVATTGKRYHAANDPAQAAEVPMWLQLHKRSRYRCLVRGVSLPRLRLYPVLTECTLAA